VALMETILFGPAAVTRESLLAMEPHMRTECLSLMRERGISEDRIARELGIGRHVVGQLVAARHAYKLREAGEEMLPQERVPDAVLERVDIGRNAFRLLRRIAAERGGWCAGRVAIARETGMSEGALETAMGEVIVGGYVERAGPFSRGKAPTYVATPKGAALIAAVTEG
jgi:biotin operon repressor